MAVRVGASERWRVPTPGDPLEGETSAFFLRIRAAGYASPPALYVTAYNTLVRRLKAAGVWAKLDVLHVPATYDASVALLNLKSSSFTCVLGSAGTQPTWAANVGYTFDGIDDRVGTGFTPSTAGGLYTLDDCSYGAFLLSCSSASAALFMGYSNDRLGLHGGNGTITARVNDGTTASTGVVAYTPSDHICVSRTSSTAYDVYHAGKKVSAQTTTSTSLDASALTFGGVPGSGSYCPCTIAAAHIGSSLSDADVLQLRSALRGYLYMVGALPAENYVSQISSTSFSKNIYPSTYIVQGAEQPWSIGREGNLWRFESRSGDRMSGDASATAFRTELASSTKFARLTDVWTSFSIYFEPGAANTSTWYTFLQYHETPDASDVATDPSIQLGLVNGDNFVLRTAGSATDPLASYVVATQRWTAPMVRGRWYNFVMRHQHDYAGAGLIQIWLDGTQVVNLSSLLFGYNNTAGDYHRFGIYRKDDGSETSIVKFANVEVSGSSLAARATTPLPIPG